MQQARFIKINPEMAEPEINAFLTHLAVKEKVSASTQNQWKNTMTGEEGQHHIHETTLQRAVKEAVRNAGVVKLAGCHSFATHLLEAGYDISAIQDFLDTKALAQRGSTPMSAKPHNKCPKNS